MAGMPCWQRLDKYRVAVAVQTRGTIDKMIARGLTLGPKASLRPAEKGYQPGFNRLQGSVFIHVTKHQNLAGARVLNYGWQQTVALAPVGIAPVGRDRC